MQAIIHKIANTLRRAVPWAAVLLIVTYAGMAAAQSQVVHPGPSWELIATGAVALLLTGVAWIVRGIISRVERLETTANHILQKHDDRDRTRQWTEASINTQLRLALAEQLPRYLEDVTKRLNRIEGRLVMAARHQQGEPHEGDVA